ncbi:MAG: redoxin domain-containing protein [Chloroflexi bacterium]|nr:redoxin domain-containing protein [Chloroflexota bacterium]
MRQKHGEIEALGAAVLAVSFEPRDRLFQLSRVLRLPFPLLSDQERDTYRAYGLQRGNLRQIFSFGTVLAYVKLLAQGRLYHFRRSDLRQLGGDFVVDPEGVIRYQYRSAAPHDRPSVEELIGNI